MPVLEEIALQYVQQDNQRAIGYGLVILGATIAGIANRSKSEIQRAPYFSYQALLYLAGVTVQFIWLQSLDAAASGYLWVLVTIDIVSAVIFGFFACQIAMARARDVYGHSRYAALAFIPLANFALLLKQSKNEMSFNRAPTIPIFTGSAGVVFGFVVLVAGGAMYMFLSSQITEMEERAQTESASPQAVINSMLRAQGLEATLQVLASDSQTPITVDDVTTLTRIQAVDSHLNRTYVVDLETLLMTDNFRSRIESGICAHPPFVPLLQAGASIQELYVKVDGTLIGRHVVTRTRCQGTLTWVIAQALALVPTLSDAHLQIFALAEIASAQAIAGDDVGVQTTSSQLLALASTLSDTPLQILALVGVARARTITGDRTGGRETFSRALSLAQTITDEQMRAHILGVIASAQARAGDRARAHETVLDALDLAGTIADKVRHQATILAEILVVKAETGDRAEADETLSEALEYAEMIPPGEGERADMLTFIAAAQSQTGDLPGAHQTLLQAVVLARKITDVASRTALFIGIASAQAKAGDRAKADVALSYAIACVRKIPEKYAQASALADIAEAQAEMGDQTEAQVTVAQALKVAQTITDEQMRAHTLAHIAYSLAVVAKTDPSEDKRKVADPAS